MAEEYPMVKSSGKMASGKKKAGKLVSAGRSRSVVKKKTTSHVPAYRHIKVLGQSVGLLTDNQAAIIKALKSGLPISSFKKLQKIMDVPAGQLATTVNIAARTLLRRGKQGKLQTDESERLLRIGRLFDLTLELFEDKQMARQWFKEPNKALGGVSPLEYSDTEPGAKEVESLIGRLDQGIFS